MSPRCLSVLVQSSTQKESAVLQGDGVLGGDLAGDCGRCVHIHGALGPKPERHCPRCPEAGRTFQRSGMGLLPGLPRAPPCPEAVCGAGVLPGQRSPGAGHARLVDLPAPRTPALTDTACFQRCFSLKCSGGVAAIQRPGGSE